MDKRWGKVCIIEVLVMVAIVGVTAALLLPALRQTPQASARSSCANNLRQWGLILRMFAEEHGGDYPRLSASPWWFFPESRDLYPDYWTDYTIALCPSDLHEMDGLSVLRIPEGDPVELWSQAAREMADGVDGGEACFHYLMSIPRSYLYPGYVCRDWNCIQGIEVLENARRMDGPKPSLSVPVSGTVCSGPVNQVNLPVDASDPPDSAFGIYQPDTYIGSDGQMGSPLYRMRSDAERFLITDIADPEAPARLQSTIPVMWDALSTQQAVDDYQGGHPALVPRVRTNHVPAGGNVLYLDGHVAFLPIGPEGGPRDDEGFPYGPSMRIAWQATNNGAG